MKMLFTLMILTTSVFAQDFSKDVARFIGRKGVSHVLRGDDSNPSKGTCSLEIIESGKNTTVKLKVQYDYGFFFSDSFIEDVYQDGEFLVYEKEPHEDFGGHLCGAPAPAKKVVEKMMFSKNVVRIEQTYRCPYFIFKTTDVWECWF